MHKKTKTNSKLSELPFKGLSEYYVILIKLLDKHLDTEGSTCTRVSPIAN